MKGRGVYTAEFAVLGFLYGSVFPSLAAIIAASFGISQAAKAEAAKNVAAQATDERKNVEEKLEKDKKIKPDLKDQIDKLEQLTESRLKKWKDLVRRRKTSQLPLMWMIRSPREPGWNGLGR